MRWVKRVDRIACQVVFFFSPISRWTLNCFVHNIKITYIYLWLRPPRCRVSLSWLIYNLDFHTTSEACFFFFLSFHQLLSRLFLISSTKFLSLSIPPSSCRSAHLGAQRGLQIVGAAEPSAAKASVWSGPLLQGWPASHPAMHLSALLHLHRHNEAQSQISEGGLNGLLMSRAPLTLHICAEAEQTHEKQRCHNNSCLSEEMTNAGYYQSVMLIQ